MPDSDQAPLRLGGMALQNGLLVHGPRHWAAAIRNADGEVEVASGAKAVVAEGRIARIPIARGVAKMAEMIAVLPQVRRALPAARLPFERGSLLAAMGASTVISAGARRSKMTPATSEAIASLLALLPALFALRSKDLARYHGAEHKTIGAYETGEEPADATKEHERCGSHLVGPLLGTSVVTNLLAARVKAPARRKQARTAASLASLGIAVEIFGWMTRNKEHPAARALARPGFELQRLLGTKEPGEEEMEVARRALGRLLELEEQ